MTQHSCRGRSICLLAAVLLAFVPACAKEQPTGEILTSDETGKVTIPVNMKVLRVESAVLNPIQRTLVLSIVTETDRVELRSRWEKEDDPIFRDVHTIAVEDFSGKVFNVPPKVDSTAPPV